MRALLRGCQRASGEQKKPYDRCAPAKAGAYLKAWILLRDGFLLSQEYGFEYNFTDHMGKGLEVS
jgi:hypothetical protein